MSDFLRLRPYVNIFMMAIPIWGLWKVWSFTTTTTHVCLIVGLVITILIGIISAYKVGNLNEDSVTKNKQALNSVLLQSLGFSLYMCCILYLLWEHSYNDSCISNRFLLWINLEKANLFWDQLSYFSYLSSYKYLMQL